jgi:Amt family ammonium transporter
VGILAFSVFAIITSLLLWSLLGFLTGGIRVMEAEEIQGLDIGEHGMEAYPDFVPLGK